MVTYEAHIPNKGATARSIYAELLVACTPLFVSLAGCGEAYTVDLLTVDGRGGEARLGPRLAALTAAVGTQDEAAAMQRAIQTGLPVREHRGVRSIPVILEPSSDGNSLAAHLEEWGDVGVEVDEVSESYVRAFFPLTALRKARTLAHLRTVRLPATMILSELPDTNSRHNSAAASGAQPVVSQAVALTGAAEFHRDGIRGAGIKVAVVDAGFSGISAAIAAGELPADTVAVIGGRTQDSPAALEGGVEHGTSVAAHVADLAPEAKVYCIQVADIVDLDNAAQFIAREGISVVNMSVGWIGLSYRDGTGPFSAIVDRSRQEHGIFWAVASGNLAESHWRGLWKSAESDHKVLAFRDGDGDGDGNGDSLRYAAGPHHTIFLSWKFLGQSHSPGRGWADLDLFVLDRDLNEVASSTTTQANSAFLPLEALRVRGAEGPFHAVVRRKGGGGLQVHDVDVTLFMPTGVILDGMSVPEASLVEPADAEGAFAVGAVHRRNWSHPKIETYSSRGPTTDGRQKPELVATTGTSASATGQSLGTSFSAPVVAGAAALLLSANAGWSADEVTTAMLAMAADPGPPGPDPIFGYGQLQLDPNFCDAVDNDGATGDGDSFCATEPPTHRPPAGTGENGSQDGPDSTTTPEADDGSNVELPAAARGSDAQAVGCSATPAAPSSPSTWFLYLLLMAAPALRRRGIDRFRGLNAPH